MKTLRCSVCQSLVRRADAFASANLLKVLMKVTLLSPASMSEKARNPGIRLRRGTRRSCTRWINSSLVPGMSSYERITIYIVLPFLLSSLEGLQKDLGWFVNLTCLLGLGEPLDVQFFAGRRVCERNSLWLNECGSTGLRPLQRLQVIQDQRGKQETLPDSLVGMCAEFAPQVTILEQLERVSCSPFCIIDEVAVRAVGDLYL